MRIDIDRERCVGSGMCVYALPAVFDQSDEDGRVVLAGGDPPTGYGAPSIRALRAAAAGCPVAAISLGED
ncbi:ferredoxin [Streptomyces sp. NPDC045431]|uniref:ferredoxin n=1 Tax=Streptomyces sp. NPDC045431 TaxID=3155613 RepID=UPI0033E22753